jgi:two-component system, NtrC family, nitrogen regulation sensor histidine kinase NtrY
MPVRRRTVAILSRALVVWLPVVYGDSLAGTVRAVRYTRQTVPVQNQYLQDYDVADEWRRDIDIPFSISLGDGFAVTVDIQSAAANTRVLYGLDGTALGTVTVDRPAPEMLLQRLTGKYNDVLSFWILLTGIWLVAGAWIWHRARIRDRQSRLREGRYASSLLTLLVVGAGWWGLRYLLLVLNIPARWLGPGAPGAALFDPTYLASTAGGGLARSAGPAGRARSRGSPSWWMSTSFRLPALSGLAPQG